jgi:hypothetical protein
MKSSVCFAVAFVAFSSGLSSWVAAADPLRSGLQAGQSVTTVFEPVNLNGPHAEEPHCLVCENGLCPVAMVLARDLSEPLGKLLARLDAACVKHSAQELGSFAVFLDAPDPLQEKLRAFAAKETLKKLVLALEAEAHIPEYKVAADADVTVMLYVRHDVKAAFAFRKGELNDAAIDAIIAALPKILIEKP